MGYLLPSENVMQILGPALALLAFARRPVRPLDQMVRRAADLAKFTPLYASARWPARR